MHKILSFYNSNRRVIWIAILAIAFTIILLQTLNNDAKKRNSEINTNDEINSSSNTTIYPNNQEDFLSSNYNSEKIQDEKLLKVIKQIIYSTEGAKGQPIGNYTSQTFANIYLNEIDQYAKHILELKYWYRYMDDMIAIVRTKQEAIDKLTKIRKFLKEKLDLELNSKTQIFKSKQGVNFCGYKINEYRMKIRDKGKKKLKNKVKILTKKIKQGTITSQEAKMYLCGHLGYIKYANTKNLTDTLFYTEN